MQYAPSSLVYKDKHKSKRHGVMSDVSEQTKKSNIQRLQIVVSVLD